MARLPFMEQESFESAERRVDFLERVADFKGVEALAMPEARGHLARLSPLGQDSRAHLRRLAAELAFAIGEVKRARGLIRDAARDYMQTEAAHYGTFLNAAFVDRVVVEVELPPASSVQQVYGYLARVVGGPESSPPAERARWREAARTHAFGRIGPHDVAIQVYLNATVTFHREERRDGQNAVDVAAMAMAHLTSAYAASLTTARRDHFRWVTMEPRIALVDLDLLALMCAHQRDGTDLMEVLSRFAKGDTAFGRSFQFLYATAAEISAD